MSLTCSRCLTHIAADPVDGRAPAWCPRCGADRKAFDIQPTSVLGVLREACASQPVAAPRAGAGLAPPGPLSREPHAMPPLPAQLADIPPEDLAALASPPRRPPQMGIAIILLGVGSLVGSFYFASFSFSKLTTCRKAEGTVVDLVVTSRSLKWGNSVHPVVAYQVGGARYQFQSAFAMGWSPYKRGDTVEVLYPREKPGEGSINSFNDMWLFPLVLAVPGVLLLLVWVCVHFGIGMSRAARDPNYAMLR